MNILFFCGFAKIFNNFEFMLNINLNSYTIVPVRTKRCFNVYTTSITLEQRRMNVKMTLCAYWELSLPRLVN